MHSRIYELKEAQTEPNQLDEYTITTETMDIYGIDYVSELSNSTDEQIKEECKIEELKWLQNCYVDSIKINMDMKSLQFTNPEKLMQSSFDEFQKVIKQLNDMTISDFCNNHPDSENPLKDIEYMMYLLNQAYADKSGFYIYDSDTDTIEPINQFIRNNADDIASKTFYIGNILDYHYQSNPNQYVVVYKNKIITY